MNDSFKEFEIWNLNYFKKFDFTKWLFHIIYKT